MRKYLFVFFVILVGSSRFCLQAQEKMLLADIDGNTYQSIVIGPYRWMAENLKTTKYNDGSEIPYVRVDSIWVKLSVGAFCWYNNNDSMEQKYGALYNWHAVNTGKLCPEGWRVPADEEWKYIEGFVDTKYSVSDPVWNNVRNRGKDASLQLKAHTGWRKEQNGPNNFGFSALPGGERCSNGRFFQEYTSGFWWTSTEYNEQMAWYRNIFYDYELVYREGHPKFFGFSVRCITNKISDFEEK